MATFSLPKKVSIVAPCLNEEGCLAEFYQEINRAIANQPYQFEMILVDDGSTDGTLEVAEQLHATDPQVKFISFSRNFGHQAALLAGLEAATGDAVITMDSDLQHPPQLLPDLLALWEQGFEIVTPMRRDTADATFWKWFTSRMFYAVINLISETPITPSADFRLMSRTVVDAFLQLREYHRFSRGLVDWLGFRVATIEFDAPPRFAGKTKYSLVKMVRFAVNGLVSFSVVPLRLTLFLGFLMAFLAMLYVIYALGVFFFSNQVVPGWTSILVVTLLIGGVQLICLGLVGEYIGKIFEEVKHRPLYVVRKRVGFSETELKNNPELKTGKELRTEG